jgi:plasmid maintenance system antidote protein VapI/Mn-dependent DtxR family transcriptional regulator
MHIRFHPRKLYFLQSLINFSFNEAVEKSEFHSLWNSLLPSIYLGSKLGPMETQNITDILKKEFINRCQRNESYSLRAYARYLNVDHSLLAKILKGEKTLSKKMAYQIGEKLGLSATRIQELFETSTQVSQSQQIREDVFIVISDWHHFAILELIKTDNFKYSPKAIARTFGITSIEVEQAFERLQRLGFLEFNDDHSVVLTKPNNKWFNHQETNIARKIMQKQLLKKAIESVDNIDFSQRANSSLTIAINPKDIPKFKKYIQNFMDGTDNLSESIKTKKKEVYQLCVAFFPLTLEETL